jgi:hypothetical protein
MTQPAHHLSQGKLKPRLLEELGFYLGAHDIDLAPVKDEIDARFARETSEEKQEPLRALHALEAKLQQVRKEKPEAEALWARIRQELGDTPPPYFQAILMVCCAIFALVLDTLFLAPTMDILNIAHPALQFLAAAGLAAICTAYFELTALLYIEGKTDRPKRLMAITVGAVGGLSLTAWGLLRGYQLRFAAALSGSPLAQFLVEHAALASVFYIFITLATPIIGAVSLLYGWQEVSHAWTWRRVRVRFETLRAAEVKLARDVQTEQESLDEFDKRKKSQFREWLAILAQFYERGKKNGACRETLWSVLRKSLLGGLVVIPLAFVIPWVWLPVISVIPILGLFTYFNHRRHYPSHERYLAQENTQFAVIPDAPASQPRELAAPKQHLLRKGDDE